MGGKGAYSMGGEWGIQYGGGGMACVYVLTGSDACVRLCGECEGCVCVCVLTLVLYDAVV